MPIVSTTPSNTFYIAVNIIFDLATGDTKNVLMLVNKAEDASVFNAEDAQNYANFVKRRASKIIWSVEQLTTGHDLERLGRFIIKGVTHHV